MSKIEFSSFDEKLFWENAFFAGIGTYISLINQHLSAQFSLEPLGNHIKILGGYAFKSTEYKSSGIPIIRISDFNNERINLKDCVYYDEVENLEKFVLVANDILIAMTGGTIGKLAIVQHGLGKLYLNQRVGKFSIINPTEFEQEYVYWLGRGVQDKVKSLAWGGSQPNVSSRDIEQLEFPIPDKTLQRKIISFLNDLREHRIGTEEYFHASTEQEILRLQRNQVRLFALRHELATQKTLLAKLREAILREAVQGKLTHQSADDEDASHLLARIKAEKAAKGIKEKPLPPIKPEEIPYQLPQGWVWCRLGEITLYSEAGKSWQCIERPANGNEWGIIKVSAITSGQFLETENKFYSADAPPSVDARIFEGDFIITRASGSLELVGKSVIVKGLHSNLLLSDKTIRFVFSDSAYTQYINLFNTSAFAREYFKKIITATSTTMKNLTREQMCMLPIPLPPLAEQQRIVAAVERLLGRVSALEQEVLQQQITLGRLMQSALREVFGGGVVEEEQPSTESEKFF